MPHLKRTFTNKRIILNLIILTIKATQIGEMKIKFKKKRLYGNLIIGILWIGLGILNIILEDKLIWIDFGYLIVGTLYIVHYLYDMNNQYLTIENGTIHKNKLYGLKNKMNIADIKWIKKFAGNYTLKSEQKKLKIKTGLITEKSRVELDKILGELNLPSE